MELDVDELFGQREAQSVRDSDSGAEDGDDSDDGGRNNPMEEAVEVPEPGQETATQQQSIKPKRVVKNPQPKLDIHRLAGPRGIGIIQKSFKNVKFLGKGNEKEDIAVLLKILEHWAHRLFPRLPFKDTLEQIEKLGMKKNVQVLMKRLRLDMFTESELNGLGEDTVRRDINDEEEKQEEPPIDVFDELLGNSGFSAPSQTVLQPSQSISQRPSQLNKTLTDEQKERLDRNRRLAEEKRLARLKLQDEEKAKQMASVVEDLEAEVETEDIFDKMKKVANVNVSAADKQEAANGASSVGDGRDAGIEDMETEEGGEGPIIKTTEEEMIRNLTDTEKEEEIAMQLADTGREVREVAQNLADTEKEEEIAMQLADTEREVRKTTQELADTEREEDDAPSSTGKVSPLDNENKEINSGIATRESSSNGIQTGKNTMESSGNGIQPKTNVGKTQLSETINKSAGESLAKENGQELAEAGEDDTDSLFTEDDMLDMLNQVES